MRTGISIWVCNHFASNGISQSSRTWKYFAQRNKSAVPCLNTVSARCSRSVQLCSGVACWWQWEESSGRAQRSDGEDKDVRVL